MLISFSGIDGAGKTTQIQLLVQYLSEQGITSSIVKAYNRGEKDLFQEYMKTIDQRAILFLFQAFHVQQYIQAQQDLQSFHVVIADRWDESYIAYHSSFGVLSTEPELRHQLNYLAFQGLKPDICFLLDIDPAIAQKRTLQRGQDYFDQKDREYHATMRYAYLQQANNQLNWFVLDASQSIQSMHQKVIQVFQEKYT